MQKGTQSHCRRRASPPQPKDTGHLNAKRLNARRWQKLAMLAPEIEYKASQNHQNILKKAPKNRWKIRVASRMWFWSMLGGQKPQKVAHSSPLRRSTFSQKSKNRRVLEAKIMTQHMFPWFWAFQRRNPYYLTLSWKKVRLFEQAASVLLYKVWFFDPKPQKSLYFDP